MLNEERIASIIDEFEARSGSEAEPTTLNTLEELVDSIVQKYEQAQGLKTTRGKGPLTAEIRNSAIIFRESIDSLGIPKPEDPVEERIMCSDELVMHFLLAGYGLYDLLDRYIRKNDLTDANDSELIKTIGAKLAAEFIEKKRVANKESELAERFPNAPTTGFEYEYFDSLRGFDFQIVRLGKDIQLLEELRDHPAKVFNRVLDKYDTKIIKQVMRLATLMGDGVSHAEIIEFLIDTAQIERDKLERVLTGKNFPSKEYKAAKGLREKISNSALDALALRLTLIDILNLTQETGDLADTINATRQRLERATRVISGDPAILGTPFKPEDIGTVYMLIPSATTLATLSGTAKTIPELVAMEEMVTTPSISVRMQLRELVYARLSGALEDSLNVHQSVSGVELSPKFSDIMEVTAILEAARFGEGSELSQVGVDLIKSGKPARYDPFYKFSKLNDGSTYYFPCHRVKDKESSTAYPSEQRPLVEFRGLGAFDINSEFSRHVRASSFVWLAAWGEQAAQTAAVDRTKEQIVLAETWEELLSEWGKLLEEKEIYQPKGKERYQGTVTDGKQIKAVGEEHYSLYMDQILLKTIEEETATNNPLQDRSSLQYRARRLITKYNKAAKKAIGY